MVQKLTILLIVIGIGIAGYLFLTYDFSYANDVISHPNENIYPNNCPIGKKLEELFYLNDLPPSVLVEPSMRLYPLCSNEVEWSCDWDKGALYYEPDEVYPLYLRTLQSTDDPIGTCDGNYFYIDFQNQVIGKRDGKPIYALQTALQSWLKSWLKN